MSPNLDPAPDGEKAFLPTRRSLLSRLRNLDDELSWRDFFDTYWKLIYSAARKAGLSGTEAEDVVQETVLTVARKIPEFRYDPAAGTFKGWLLRTTRWRILDHVRRRKRHLGVSHDLEADDARRTEEMEQVPDPAGERVEQVWEAEWEQNLVDAALSRIKRQVKPKHYQAYELYVLKGSGQQLACALAGFESERITPTSSCLARRRGGAQPCVLAGCLVQYWRAPAEVCGWTQPQRAASVRAAFKLHASASTTHLGDRRGGLAGLASRRSACAGPA